MAALLISEPPLQVLPSLAVKIGLNEAIILQQFHYWLERSTNIRDNYRWIYNSYSKWNEQFPFWSNATIRRTINSLEKQGVLISANYNQAGFDKTKWYRIDYEWLSNASAQNEQTSCSKCTSAVAQNEQTNTNRLPETTTENNKTYSSSTDEPSVLEQQFDEIWNEYPNKTGKKTAFNHYKAWRKKSSENTNEYLKQRLELYKKDLSINDWKRPMNGSTWFNGRFEDEFDTKPKPQQFSKKKIVQRETLPDWATDDTQKDRAPKEVDPAVQAKINKQLANLKSRNGKIEEV